MAKSLASSIKILPVVKSAGGFVSKALKNGVYIRSETSPDDISRPVSVHDAFLASQPRSLRQAAAWPMSTCHPCLDLSSGGCGRAEGWTVNVAALWQASTQVT